MKVDNSRLGIRQEGPGVTALDEKLSAVVARGDVPGLVVAATNRDGMLYQGAFGQADVARAR